MNKIVGQHAAEQQAQFRAEKRAKIMGRVQGVILFLLLAGILAVIYVYRDQIKDAIMPKHKAALASDTTNSADATNTPQGQTTSVINNAQQNAATRDAIIDQIAK